MFADKERSDLTHAACPALLVVSGLASVVASPEHRWDNSQNAAGFHTECLRLKIKHKRSAWRHHVKIKQFCSRNFNGKLPSVYFWKAGSCRTCREFCCSLIPVYSIEIKNKKLILNLDVTPQKDLKITFRVINLSIGCFFLSWVENKWFSSWPLGVKTLKEQTQSKWEWRPFLGPRAHLPGCRDCGNLQIKCSARKMHLSVLPKQCIFPGTIIWVI